MLIYRIVRGVVRFYLRIFYHLKVYGADNIPNSGAVILVANHISNLDPPVLACITDRQVHFMAKEELFKVPILGSIASASGSFPVKRGGNDRKAIKIGLALLAEKKVLAIFPEGTRSKTGEMGEGLPGAALFALKANAQVVPIGIVSSYGMFKNIHVNIGKPLNLEEYRKEKSNSEDLANVMKLMMAQIKEQVNEIKSYEDIN